MEHLLWTEKYRPKTIEECILPERLKKPFQEYVNQKNIPNLLLSGGAGVGKTTVAKAMCEEIGCDVMVINGSDEGRLIDTFRTKIKNFASSMSLAGGRKVVIIDEADYCNAESVQPALRNFIEEFAGNCSFIFTCNYVERIIEPLQSRLAVFELNPPTPLEVGKHILGILDTEEIKYEKADVATLVKKFYPDIRKVLNISQSCIKDKTLVLDSKLVNQSGVGNLILDQLRAKSKDSFNMLFTIFLIFILYFIYKYLYYS